MRTALLTLTIFIFTGCTQHSASMSEDNASNTKRWDFKTNIQVNVDMR